MDVKWDYVLKDWQVSNPAVHAEFVELPQELNIPTVEQLTVKFPTSNYKLQTWARDVGDDGKTKLLNDPHWLAVRGSTPLHTDPRYPRYSHQLKIRVDDGVFIRGLDKQETQLVRGLFYILDTHSPHQVLCKEDKKAWNVTISIDHKIKLNPKPTIERLIEWGLQNQDAFTK